METGWLSTTQNEFIGRDDDIFVVTYPQSGTTWTEQIVHLILNQEQQGEQLLTDAASWLERLPRRPNGINGFLQGLRGRRLFTSHLPIALTPDPNLDIFAFLPERNFPFLVVTGRLSTRRE
jgi:hypothetical protein